ncbi:hypothetical protein [Comamonas sp. B21-038]|uniref:hypothetical protein n=1 Tax=Comamonas sp. B21-038 TaxID=2918299 RepID=UPI001EFB0A7F|nr:hypothetical protein [Comamonas sp. B21-038]ULR87211.1 hypothetical protein MJ205_12040 [Comamonas sp. B21-038]
MSEIIPRSTENATEARANPKQGRNPRPQPPMRCNAPALPEPLDAEDLRTRAHEIGIHWWSIIDSILMTHRNHDRIYPEPLEPLPQWAVERLQDQGRHRSSEEEFSRTGRLLKEWLRLTSGEGSEHFFEIWTSNGARLSVRHESWVKAADVLIELKKEHPTAFIARVHKLSGPPRGQILQPELLDTLIGAVDHIGTGFADDEEEYTVQDETGRQVSVLATTLRQHPIYERLNTRGKESLDHYLNEDKPRKDAIRKAAAERDAGAAP